jgi:hypothetical protein
VKTDKPTFLSYYKAFFGDKRFAWVDLLVEDEGPHVHIPLDSKYNDPKAAAETFDKYVHPCWCSPELVYADDDNCNEVWLHKRVQ